MYSRRTHLRIYGLQTKVGVSCKEAVAEFVHTHLKNEDGEHLTCAASDIDAAHQLPLQTITEDDPQTAEEDSHETHPKTKRIRIPAIIVRFHERDIRDSIIKARRSLKGKRSCPEAPKYRIVVCKFNHNVQGQVHASLPFSIFFQFSFSLVRL